MPIVDTREKGSLRGFAAHREGKPQEGPQPSGWPLGWISAGGVDTARRSHRHHLDVARVGGWKGRGDAVGNGEANLRPG